MTQNKKTEVEEKKHHEAIEPATGNNLFPVFLKLEKLRLLIVGGGKVALEKLHAVLLNSPATQISIIAIEFTEPTRNLAMHHENIQLIEKAYEPSDVDNADVIII